VTEVEPWLVTWAVEIGIWSLFLVMTMIAQVMELAARDSTEGIADEACA
jgi:hypothetical protein